MKVCEWCNNKYVDLMGHKESDRFCCGECRDKAKANEKKKLERDMV